MTEQTIDTSSEALARRLDEAWESRQPVAPLSESAGLESIEHAYAIQQYWTGMREKRSERVIGRKIGLTSPAMQEQFGVDEPDYGSLWDSRFFPAEEGQVEIPADTFIEPRLEGEIAFLLKRPLSGPNVTLQDAMEATEALAVAVEVVDSRIADWRIKLVDTIADNASYGGVTTGPWNPALREADLRTLGMLIHRNGDPVVQGLGAAALGHPARAVAWLANKLASFDVELRPGDVILSGSLGKAIPVRQGDVFVLETHGQPSLTVAFS